MQRDLETETGGSLGRVTDLTTGRGLLFKVLRGPGPGGLVAQTLRAPSVPSIQIPTGPTTIPPVPSRDVDGWRWGRRIPFPEGKDPDIRSGVTVIRLQPVPQDVGGLKEYTSSVTWNGMSLIHILGHH